MTPKRILLIAATLTAGVFAGDVLLGYLLWRIEHEQSPLVHVVRELRNEVAARSRPPDEPAHRVHYSPRPLFGPDPELGFVTLPGSYTVRIDETGTTRHHDFQVTVLGNGSRRCAPDADVVPDRPEIWLLGDSFMFGWGNDDETTLGWFLQRFLPDRTVLNLAGPGYGNLQALLMLRRRLPAVPRRPEILVMGYADYYHERNAAAPERLSAFRFNADTDATPAWAGGDPSAFTHPRARIRDGELVIDTVPLFEPDDPSPGRRRKRSELSFGEQQALTSRILAEIADLARQSGSRPVLAWLQGDSSDPVVEAARRAGFAVADLRPDLHAGDWDDFLPFDPHPGPRAHAAYARKLYRTLVRLPAGSAPGPQ